MALFGLIRSTWLQKPRLSAPVVSLRNQAREVGISDRENLRLRSYTRNERQEPIDNTRSLLLRQLKHFR
jgi:hypothetical protein